MLPYTPLAPDPVSVTMPLSGLAYGPLVSNSLFPVEGHLVRPTFNG